MNRKFKGNMTKKHKKSPSGEGLVLRFCRGSVYIFCRCRRDKGHCGQLSPRCEDLWGQTQHENTGKVRSFRRFHNCSAHSDDRVSGSSTSGVW